MLQMPWGKYRGWRLADVPASYLCWCLEDCDLRPHLERAIRAELAGRFGGAAYHAERSATPARDAVNAWYRRLALRFHPDRGGSDRDMAVVNVARDELEAALLR